MAIAKEYTKPTRAERIEYIRSTIFAEEKSDPTIGNVSLVRAKIATEAYKQFMGLPAELLRAKMLEKVLSEIPIYLIDGELIAGHSVSSPRSVELFPEFGVDWAYQEIDTFETREADKFRISEADKLEMKEILDWWKGKTVNDSIQTILGPDYSLAARGLIFMATPAQFSGSNCSAVDCEQTLFKYGLNGMKEQVLAKLNALDLSDVSNVPKKIFYDACIISIDATINFAHRNAELCRDLAKKEADPFRKAELEQMAKNCEWVPANPPRNLWEALQSYHMIHCAFSFESASFIFIPGRMDQYLFPYYQRDIDEGVLTRDSAQELIENALLKYSDSKILWDSLSGVYYSGNPAIHVVTLGGVTPDGNDATNELTYIIMDSFKHLKTQQPELCCVIHKNTPDEFLQASSEMIKMGIAHPKIGVLETMQLTKSKEPYNYTKEELNNLAWAGCGETVVPGKDRSGPDFCYTTGPMVSLELALNNGILRLSGDQIGPQTGDPKKFKTFEEVWEAFKKQHSYAVNKCVTFRGAIQYAQQELCPTPLRSVFTLDCIEKGVDRMKGGARYNSSSGSDIGAVTCGDAIAALKKVVFEDKKYTIAEVVDALAVNFEGYEEMQKVLLSAPKFGNDIDYVDNLVRDIGSFMNAEYKLYPEIHGGFHKDTFVAVTGGIAVGRMVGATPDGRNMGDPLNEGGVSPQQGRDVNGPTAVMKSVAKLDWSTTGGGILNIKFNTSALNGEDGSNALIALLKSYQQMGGYHVQFNVIDLETLKDAQAHPEKYPDLLVRVAAYSAYFIQLSKALQDDIIARTEYGSVY